MAYRDQSYSEPIHVLHPRFSGAIYKLIYKWGNTHFSDLLDGDSIVRLHIREPGRVSIQFVAENVLTGEILLTSKPFDLIVHQGINIGPDRFINGTFYGRHHGYHGCNNDLSGVTDSLMRIGVELADEQRVRSEQDSLIWEEIIKIKEQLALIVMSDEG